MSLSSNDRYKTEALSKVPVITAFFWIVKILTTAMGEAASDFAVHINQLDAVILGATGFIVALAIQFSARRYIAWVYWLLVAMVSVFGTMAADVIHHAGVPVPVSTAVFGILLAGVFAFWYKVEGTLSVHSIVSPRREAFYWLTVFVSFAFGTAAGDWTAESLQFGTLLSGFLFAALFALPAIAYWKFGLNEIVAFWFAYIMTRPLGASFADWAAQPQSHGGLGYGPGYVSSILTIFILIFVAYLSVGRGDDRRRQDGIGRRQSESRIGHEEA
jgi:uncharacterized membrane-anchored protein